jgi:kynureninase
MVSQHQTGLLTRLVDELGVPEALLTRDRDTPRERFGGFLALESPRAEELARELTREGVLVDARGRYLRLGPAPYLSDAQLEESIARLADVVERITVSLAP